MYLAHPVKGCQLNDCGATSWYTDRAKAAAKGQSRSKDCSVAARLAVPKDQLRQLVRTFFLRDEFTLLAVLRWMLVLGH